MNRQLNENLLILTNAAETIAVNKSSIVSTSSFQNLVNDFTVKDSRELIAVNQVVNEKHDHKKDFLKEGNKGDEPYLDYCVTKDMNRKGGINTNLVVKLKVNDGVDMNMTSNNS